MPLTVRSRRTRNAASRRGIAAVLEALEERALLTTYTMPLVNSTGLDTSKFSVYVDGFSVKNTLQLAPSSTPGVLTFVAADPSGTVPSFQVGTGPGQYDSIQFDSTQENQGARIYLFVVPAGDTAPSFPFGQQPPNPPNYAYPYVYVEYTEPPSLGLPTVDVSTVDAFTLPVTLTLNDGLGQVGQPLGGGSTVTSPPPSRPSWDHMRGPGLISRPPLWHPSGPAPIARPPWGHMRGPGLATSSAGVTRASILAQYQEWAAAPSRAMYRPLLLPASADTDGQSAGILNPFSYLIDAAAGSPLPAHASSPLNDVFDLALSKLFSTSGWSLQGTDGAVYTAQAGSYQYMSFTNPVTGAPVMLDGLQFTGGGNTFHVYSPLGVNTFRGVDGKAILGSTPAGGSTDQLVLVNAPLASAIQPGTYVFGTGFDQSNGVATNYVRSVSQTSAGTTITLASPLAGAISDVRLVFSPVPTLSTMQFTAGAMVFGGAGFFADSVQQGYSDTPQQTLGNLENQIDAALNRGVAVAPGALNPSTNGATSAYWGTESNWYPAGQPQNLFSRFMHTATIGGQPIYVQPPNPALTATGLPMSQVYGFAFDENPGPVPPAPAGQAEVPAKFDPVPAGTTTFTVTLGPWN